jgi:hypothetical protein
LIELGWFNVWDALHELVKGLARAPLGGFFQGIVGGRCAAVLARRDANVDSRIDLALALHASQRDRVEGVDVLEVKIVRQVVSTAPRSCNRSTTCSAPSATAAIQSMDFAASSKSAQLLSSWQGKGWRLH